MRVLGHLPFGSAASVMVFDVPQSGLILVADVENKVVADELSGLFR